MSRLDPETAAMLRDAVARHAERHGDGPAIRAARDSATGPQAADAATMAEQGWLALALPEEAGGMGLGLSAAALVAEGLAGCFTADPFPALFLAGRCLALAGGDTALCEGLAGGTLPLALAWQEGAEDFAHPQPRDMRWAGGRLTGTKGWIAGAAGARQMLVAAQEDGQTVLALIAVDAPGVTLTFDRRADGAPLGRLRLDRTEGVPLAAGLQATAALRRALDETSVLIGAELMGHIDRMMDLTLEHLKTRRQFGQPIGAFQALQHRAADMFVRQRLARAVLTAGLARLDALPDDPVAFGMQTARLRARLNDTALWVMRESIQLFGAMGITEENDLSLHVKRCLALTGWLGNSTAQRRYFMDLAAPAGQWAEGRI